MDFDPDIIRYTAAGILALGAVWALGYFSGKRAAGQVAVARVVEPERIGAVTKKKFRRRPVVRALFISLLVHAALVAIFSIYVVSEAVYRAVKNPERQEVTLRSDALARERLALKIREASASLPPVPVRPMERSEATGIERLPLPEIAMRELAEPMAAPVPIWDAEVAAGPELADRFEPTPLEPVAKPMVAMKLPELRLDEPEPAPDLEQAASKTEYLPELPPTSVAAAQKVAPELAIPELPAPPPMPLTKIVPVALDVPVLAPTALTMEMPELLTPPELDEPALALETRPDPSDRYLLRDRKMRERALPELGGSPETEAAIERALQWLARHQEADGSWKIDRFGGAGGHDVAATSLAALAFLAWGTDPAAGDEFGKAAGRALDWLLERTTENGDLRKQADGRSGNMYDQGMAGIALAEAFALTGDERFRVPAQRAIDYIVAAQNKGDGGWRYQPGEGGDMSVFGWQVMAITSARSSGLVVPEETFVRARSWLDHVGGGEHGGQYGYQDKSPKPAMVAEGMFCCQLIGRDDPAQLESAGFLSGHLPRENERDFYYWYYGALALYQHGGPVWEEWNTRLRPILLDSQRRDGEEGGSWDPNSRWGDQAGRVVVTALATLTLEVYYRYLSLHDGG